MLGSLNKHKNGYSMRFQKLTNKKNTLKKLLNLTCYTVFALIFTDFVNFSCNFTWFSMMYKIRFHVYNAYHVKILPQWTKSVEIRAKSIWQAKIKDIFLCIYPPFEFLKPHGISVLMILTVLSTLNIKMSIYKANKNDIISSYFDF